MDTVPLQLWMAFSLFVIPALIGLVPIKYFEDFNKNSKRSKHLSWMMTLTSCFGGGVFIAIAFLYIYPHLLKIFKEFTIATDYRGTLPIPAFFVCVGFFLVYFLEEFSLKIFTQKPKKNIEIKNERTPLNEIGPNISTIEQEPETYLAAKTHEIVMDRSIAYLTNPNNFQHRTKSMFFALAMSLHSILEGVALGVQDNERQIWIFFIALIIHKGIEAFSVGLQMTTATGKGEYLTMCTIAVFALMTPIGSLSGVVLLNVEISLAVKKGIIVLLEGLSGGTIIYVTFLDILAQERADSHSNLIQLAAIILGFAMIVGLGL
uniref:Uncharacterized protein n=2 Tax=Panagrolaimus sp. JU765 TaxID=591449 RepID=A0AC34QVY3_9BILA